MQVAPWQVAEQVSQAVCGQVSPWQVSPWQVAHLVCGQVSQAVAGQVWGPWVGLQSQVEAKLVSGGLLGSSSGAWNIIHERLPLERWISRSNSSIGSSTFSPDSSVSGYISS